MKRTIVLLIPLLLMLGFSGFKPQANSTLKVEVSNIENKAGTKIWVSVFLEKDFLEKSVQTKSVVVDGSKIVAEFDLPAGEYAVSTYHDVNNNGKLDRYFFGKPKEPYGFSNNVKPLGPPSYKDCKFNLSNSPKSVSIKLLN